MSHFPRPLLFWSYMKHLALLLALTGLLFSLPQTLRADPVKMDNAIELLRQAKDSTTPLPLLEKALADLKESKPTPKGTAAVNRKKAAGLEAAGKEHKQKAVEAVEEAIKTAKEGGDVKPKIEHAIAEVHSLADLKN